MVRSIFQTLSNTYTRWKVYKTYVAPIIDWFIPTIFLLRHDPLAAANKIEVFQQRMLTLATGASRCTNRDEVNHNARERPVKLKCLILADKLSTFFYRDVAEMMASENSVVGNQPMRLRSGANKHDRLWAGTEKQDFGDRVYILKHKFDALPEEEKTLHKSGAPGTLPFDPTEVDRWAKISNRKTKQRIERRRRCAEQGISVSDLAPFLE